MAKHSKQFTVIRRTDSKSYRLTLNPSCGLPERVCAEWFRRSFQLLPAELADYRSPKNKEEAEASAIALIIHLKRKREEEGCARRAKFEDITVGAWIKKFTNKFAEWLTNAWIELDGRKIVPHSSRHSLASLLETRGVSLRYIQDLLSHSDLKTTKTYLHSTGQTIRDIGEKITEAWEKAEESKERPQNIIDFKVS